jgi:hypothetical protein
MINDDRFILHTLDKWNFGLDYTGDLMNVKNMLHIVKKAVEMGDVLLVSFCATVLSLCLSQALKLTFYLNNLVIVGFKTFL